MKCTMRNCNTCRVGQYPRGTRVHYKGRKDLPGEIAGHKYNNDILIKFDDETKGHSGDGRIDCLTGEKHDHKNTNGDRAGYYWAHYDNVILI